MAEAVEHALQSLSQKRILLMTEDLWLRFRLQRELRRAGCEVITLARLRPGDLPASAPFDMVLLDAAVFPEGGRLEALRALRRWPRVQVILLVGTSESYVTERARQSGFDLVLERPAHPQALSELVRKLISQVPSTALSRHGRSRSPARQGDGHNPARR